MCVCVCVCCVSVFLVCVLFCWLALLADVLCYLFLAVWGRPLAVIFSLADSFLFLFVVAVLLLQSSVIANMFAFALATANVLLVLFCFLFLRFVKPVAIDIHTCLKVWCGCVFNSLWLAQRFVTAFESHGYRILISSKNIRNSKH